MINDDDNNNNNLEVLENRPLLACAHRYQILLSDLRAMLELHELH